MDSGREAGVTCATTRLVVFCDGFAVALPPSMKSLLGLVSVVLLAGCPPTEDPDVESLYQRGSEDVLFCQNGAFSARLSTGTIEGLWTVGPDNAAGPADRIAVVGTSGAPAFTIVYRSAGSYGSVEIGEGWVSYGVEDSQHAEFHARCQALEAQPWWH